MQLISKFNKGIRVIDIFSKYAWLIPLKSSKNTTEYKMCKNMYNDKLDDIVNKCNNTYYRTIKMKPVDVKSITYINSSK